MFPRLSLLATVHSGWLLRFPHHGVMPEGWYADEDSIYTFSSSLILYPSNFISNMYVCKT